MAEESDDEVVSIFASISAPFKPDRIILRETCSSDPLKLTPGPEPTSSFRFPLTSGRPYSFSQIRTVDSPSNFPFMRYGLTLCDRGPSPGNTRTSRWRNGSPSDKSSGMPRPQSCIMRPASTSNIPAVSSGHRENAIQHFLRYPPAVTGNESRSASSTAWPWSTTSSLMIQTQSESQPNYEMICTTRGHKDGVVYNGTCADSSVYTRKNPGVIRPLVFSPPPPVVTLSSGHRYQSVSSVLRQNYFDSTPGCDDTPPRRGRREVAASRKEIFLSNDANACPQEAFRHEREKKRTYAGIPNRKEAQRHFVELADAAKRSGDWREARRLCRVACDMQPYAAQGWLELSKMEEECGCLIRSGLVVRRGLEFCALSDALLTRAIKYADKIDGVEAARALISPLKHAAIDKVWRAVLEGALLEARCGNVIVSRQVFKFLMERIPWYGPIYYEAFRLEERVGRDSAALDIVEGGLVEIPRYGPLWFGAFRVCERLDTETGVDGEYKSKGPVRTHIMLERALHLISKELIWKVHFEGAQIEERFAASAAETARCKGNLNRARRSYVRALRTCPTNLRWKVWLAGGRMELSRGHQERALLLFARALREAPSKSRFHVHLECARLEEYTNQVNRARSIIRRAYHQSKCEWKLTLESVLLEHRAGLYDKAARSGKLALGHHGTTGRLWAVVIQQLRKSSPNEEMQRAFKRALKEVPKSGEVWCEGARARLSPVSQTFDLSAARAALNFATQFTPQYGDSFVEEARLQLLEALERVLLSTMRQERKQYQPWSGNTAIGEVIHLPNVSKAQLECALDVVAVARLDLKCANADPNYGAAWFECRIKYTDTARKIMNQARSRLLVDIHTHQHVYAIAIARRNRIVSQLHDAAMSPRQLHRAEGDYASADFITGLIDLSRLEFGKCSRARQFNVLFGTDFAVP